MMYIKRLIFHGEDVENASLDFYPGFNSVTGASDSGKSLVYSLINFALGMSFPAEKLPQEAEGYNDVYLEIEASGKTYTLLRKIDDPNSILVFEMKYESINVKNVSSYHEYSTSNGAKGKKSFSSFIMNAIGCKYTNLVLEDGKNEGFTISKWLRLVMLDERRVYAEHSIIYSTASKTEFTQKGARAAFYSVIRGADDKPVEKKKDVKISIAKLQGQCDQIEEFLEEAKARVNEIDSELDTWDLIDIEKEIQEIECSLDLLERDYKSSNEHYARNARELNVLSEEHDRILHIVLRMELLKKNLQSDIQRLGFIEQAYTLTDQLVTLECPLCHSSLDYEKSESELEAFLEASEKERKKTLKQINDLSETISGFNEELIALDKQTEMIKEQQQTIHNHIWTSVRENIQRTLEKLESYKQLRDQFSEKESKEELIEAYQKRKNEIELEIKSIKSRTSAPKQPLIIDEAKLNEFCSKVQNYLQKWGFSKQQVYFNVMQDDIRVGTKEKMSYGKGACAILNSAFIIGLMDYTLAKGYSHPGFVLIDSPITAYKDKDVEYIDDEVPLEVKTCFYDTLERISPDRQIIVFENVEPNGAGVEQNMHHFTGNQELFRAGFIPKKK